MAVLSIVPTAHDDLASKCLSPPACRPHGDDGVTKGSRLDVV